MRISQTYSVEDCRLLGAVDTHQHLSFRKPPKDPDGISWWLTIFMSEEQCREIYEQLKVRYQDEKR